MARVGAPRPDLDGPGTLEATWADFERLRDLVPWIPQTPPSGRAVVVAPHPDDEVLGAGGTQALLAAAGSSVLLISVTDGERSHPGREEELRSRRPCESAQAAAALGAPPDQTLRLGHPDGGVDEARLTAELETLLQPGDLVLAPWRRDGHPDHDRVGRASLTAGQAAGADVLAYLVWMWHWASPSSDIPWDGGRVVRLGPEVSARKRRAVACFHTQISGDEPILRPPLLRHWTRTFEVFLRP